MPWTPNPDVPAFVPKSIAPNPPVNAQKPITILSKQNDKSATNKTTKKSMKEKKSETNSSDGKFTIQQVDFPAMVSEPQTQENLIWSRAGFRSFKDVAASDPLPKPCSSKTIGPMEVSSEKQDETEKKKKKKSKKKSEDVNAKPVKTRPKSQGMTLDQIVVAKFIQEVSKKTTVSTRPKKADKVKAKKTTVSTRPKKVDKVKAKKSRNHETPRNQLDSTAPKMRKGKTREVPKKKKPTTLKKFIMMEKEVRKRNLAASKEFKRKNLELVVDAAIKSVDFSELTSMEKRFEENGIGDHACEVEREKKEDMNDLMTSMESLSLEQKVTHLIHCNYYRDYCNQCVTDEIDHLATSLLAEIVRFQDRMHAKDPQKASIKRRYCCGLREVEKYLTIKKVKCLLVAPDIQKIMTNGVLDQTVHKLIEKSQETETPIVFCLTRKQLGYLCKKRANISCVAILNPSGADETFKSLIQSAMDSKKEYEDLRSEITTLLVPEEGNGTTISKECLSREIDEVRKKMKRQTFFWKRKKIEK